VIKDLEELRTKSSLFDINELQEKINKLSAENDYLKQTNLKQAGKLLKVEVQVYRIL